MGAILNSFLFVIRIILFELQIHREIAKYTTINGDYKFF